MIDNIYQNAIIVTYNIMFKIGSTTAWVNFNELNNKRYYVFRWGAAAAAAAAPRCNFDQNTRVL